VENRSAGQPTFLGSLGYKKYLLFGICGCFIKDDPKVGSQEGQSTDTADTGEISQVHPAPSSAKEVEAPGNTAPSPDSSSALSKNSGDEPKSHSAPKTESQEGQSTDTADTVEISQEHPTPSSAKEVEAPGQTSLAAPLKSAMSAVGKKCGKFLGFSTDTTKNDSAPKAESQEGQSTDTADTGEISQVHPTPSSAKEVEAPGQTSTAAPSPDSSSALSKNSGDEPKSHSAPKAESQEGQSTDTADTGKIAKEHPTPSSAKGATAPVPSKSVPKIQSQASTKVANSPSKQDTTPVNSETVTSMPKIQARPFVHKQAEGVCAKLHEEVKDYDDENKLSQVCCASRSVGFHFASL
jgi:hypothetical protein